MSKPKRYFWLKLSDKFFDEIYIKALRQRENGDTLIIIYLKMGLSALKSDGVITYGHYFPSFTAELANALNETEKDIESALKALCEVKAIEIDDDSIFLLRFCDCFGSECESAQRVRTWREKQKNKLLQSNLDVKDSNKDVTTEKEKEKDINKEQEKDNNISSPTDNSSSIKTDCEEFVSSFNSICKSLPKVQKITDKRKSSIKAAARFLDEMNTNKEVLFSIVENSDFLTGRSGKWSSCCFDWIIKPNNITKIIEGTYSNKVTSARKTKTIDYNLDGFFDD